MTSTESRSGFRLPWSSDRPHESPPADAIEEPAPEPAAGDIAWPDGELPARLGVTPTEPRPYEPAPEASGAVDPVQAAPTAATQEPAMIETASTPPAPVAPRKQSKLMVDLSAAIRATADAARQEALAKIDADVADVVAEIRLASKEGEVALKIHSDEDVAAIREWSKAEIARIKEQTEARIEARKVTLADEIAAYAAEIGLRVGAVESLATDYRAAMGAYADRLSREDDPARLATMAESMPEPPFLAEVIQADVADLPQPEPEAVAEPVAEVIVSAESVAAEAWDGSDQAVELDGAAGAVLAGTEAAAEVVVEDEVDTGIGAVDAGEGEEAEATGTADAVADANEPAGETDASVEARARLWGAPTPWADPDTFQPRAENEGGDVPRWTAGDSPDGSPESTEGGDPVDRGAIMAALEAAAEAVVAAEAAAESADQAEAAADVAETAAELVVGRTGNADDLDPEAQAAFSARVDAGGFDTESFTDRLASLMPGHEPVADDGTSRVSQVIVSGLVSVASIASFKRHLSRISGVEAVAVASGPEGEFVFNVTHRADASLRDAIPTLPGFAARVTSAGDGLVTVTARDPEAEG